MNVAQDTLQITNARRRPQQPTKYEDLIINTLIKVTNEGKAKNTVRCFSSALRRISQQTDLHNPEQVKSYIANLNRNPQTKNTMALAYNWYCKTNGIQWTKPYFKWERKVPLIPTTESINKIISASSKKYATLFTILAETGLEAHELSTMQRKDINATEGIIAAQGCKGHNSRSLKLKQATAEMLRTYLAEFTQSNPFPNPHALGEAWRDTRNQLAKKLNQPELKNIPMRNLRHHFATQLYDQTKDLPLVMVQLGHKKIETTLFYTRLHTYAQDDEYNVKGATNVKEATDLIEHGFQYVTDMDGIKLFRKRK